MTHGIFDRTEHNFAIFALVSKREKIFSTKLNKMEDILRIDRIRVSSFRDVIVYNS